jgi:adenylylsulfate kinase
VSWAVWITGVPGSGKSAIARAAAAELARHGERVQILELDALRRVLTPAPTYDDTEREAVYRALVFLARTLTAAGRSVIIDATAHRRAWRDLARASISDFAEVQLECPLDVARRRERTRPPGAHPRAVYAHAGRPGATVPGVDVPYEPARAPELRIDTTRETVEAAGARVAALARSLARSPAPPPRLRAGWTIWITGRPGSGKTTVVAEVCASLRARGVAVAVLEGRAIGAAIVPEGFVSTRQREIAARALVLAAKLLNEAAVPVIVDGPAPAPAAGRLAREMLAPFAEVELVCAPEVCRMRERAVRWNLVPCPGTSQPMAAPELGLDYEPPAAAEVTVNTETLDKSAAAAAVLHLIARLERAGRDVRLAW